MEIRLRADGVLQRDASLNSAAFAASSCAQKRFYAALGAKVRVANAYQNAISASPLRHDRCTSWQANDQREFQTMDAITITCEVCGQTAVIHKVRYKYVERKLPSSSAVDHVLHETQRDIECPNCGMRTQIEACRDH